MVHSYGQRLTGHSDCGRLRAGKRVSVGGWVGWADTATATDQHGSPAVRSLGGQEQESVGDGFGGRTRQ